MNCSFPLEVGNNRCSCRSAGFNCAGAPGAKTEQAIQCRASCRPESLALATRNPSIKMVRLAWKNGCLKTCIACDLGIGDSQILPPLTHDLYRAIDSQWYSDRHLTQAQVSKDPRVLPLFQFPKAIETLSDAASLRRALLIPDFTVA